MKAGLVKVDLQHYALKIYIGGALHLSIPHGTIAGIQSWRDGPKHFSIEYYLANGSSILTEYDDPEKWRAVLAGLDSQLPH